MGLIRGGGGVYRAPDDIGILQGGGGRKDIPQLWRDANI